MMIHLVFSVIKFLNYFPPKGGVSQVLSPKAIMLGENLEYKKHLNLPFGQYVQVHKEDTPHNSMNVRTRGAIALGPTGSLGGSHKFMVLDTSKKITRLTWDVLPMPDTIIVRVNTLTANQPQQLNFYRPAWSSHRRC